MTMTFSTKEISEVLGVCTRRVVYLIASKKLDANRRHGDYIVERDALIKYMRKRNIPLTYFHAKFTQHFLVVGCGLVWGALFAKECQQDEAWKCHLVTDLLNAGVISSTYRPACLVIDQFLVDSGAPAMLSSMRALGCQLAVVLQDESSDDSEWLRSLGFDRVVRKPANPAQLAADLRKALDGKVKNGRS